MPADAGIRFGQYVLLRRIARGGMAEVFLAQQRGLEGFDRRVAVKRILPHLVDSPDFVKMFLGEAKLAAQLTHPNVVHIYDFGKVDNDYFIAMEYVDGVHAGQIFKRFESERERLSPTLIARVGADAATALHYAHELLGAGGKPLGLVHRDVSPANLMVSYDGVVKLCDFGIAKAAALQNELTNPGQVKGKYAYMSPEQTIAAPLDGRSDVFSLAIILWELLAGRTIVPRGDAVDAMRAIRDGKLPPIREVAPGTPEPLAKAITWGLETKRERRATAVELATALEAFIKASPELATPMQLAQWVRTRFPRAETGPLRSLAAASAAGPGTSVVQGTMAVPKTAASARQPQITPPSAVAGPSRVIAAEDSATMFAADHPQPPELPTMIDSPQRLALRASEATLFVEPSRRAGVEVTERDGPLDVGNETQGGEEGDGETVMRSGAVRPIIPNQGAVVTQYQPRLESQHAPQPLPQPLPFATDAVRLPLLHRVPRRVLAIAALFGIAVLSFVIALAARSSPRPAAREAAADAGAIAIADAAAAPAVDAGVAAVAADASAPTLAPDATIADTTTILKVNTRPPGGLVKVGDQRRTAPAEFALPAGKHVVVIELDGWQPERRKIDLPYGVDTLLEMAFTRRTPSPRDKPHGKLTVRTIPWSDVYLGTRKIGQAPFADLDMPAGRYRLLFKNPSHPTVRRTVTITANRTTKLNFNLP